MFQLFLLYSHLVLLLIYGIVFLHLLPRWGLPGKKISDWFYHAPGIDLAPIHNVKIASQTFPKRTMIGSILTQLWLMLGN